MKALNVAIIWTYNQPYLKDRQGNFVLPTIRQYLQRDYIDMIKIAKKYPSLKLSFNITPFLFEQAADYVYSEAQDYTWLLSKKNTTDMSLQEKEFVIRHFFKGVDSVIVHPYPRYSELYQKKLALSGVDESKLIAEKFSEQEIRDLQVWHNLAWIGKESQKEVFVKGLIEKNRDYTEADKKALIEFIRTLHQSMFKLYYEQFQSKNIELSTTAFYNPILPLALDNHSVNLKGDNPQLPMRRLAAEDLMMEQVLKARKFNKKFFEQTSIGIQSPDFAIDNKTLDLYAKARFEWTVLEKYHLGLSLKTDEMIYPYEYTSNNQHFINCFVNFSDIANRFQNEYPNMPSKDAVNDIIKRLEEVQKVADATDKDKDSIVVLSLSGDTLWDAYKQSGTEFLHLLYGALEKNKNINSCTPSDYLNLQPTRTLINSVIEESSDINYQTWIGNSAANRAWDKVSETYRFYLKQEATGEYSEQTLREAKTCIQKALNANWFKSYGSEDSIWDDYYDELFRSILIECYEILYQKPPMSLFYNLKNASSEISADKYIYKLIYPEIDGEDTSTDEWDGAVEFDINQFQLDAGNQLYKYLRSISVGYNETHLCFHISFNKFPQVLSHFKIDFHQPIHSVYEFQALQDITKRYVEILGKSSDEDSFEELKSDAQFEIDTVWECLIPISELDVKEGSMLTMQFLLGMKESIIERFPMSSTISLPYSIKSIKAKAQ